MRIEIKTTEQGKSLFWKNRILKQVFIDGIETNIHHSNTFGSKYSQPEGYVDFYKQIKQVFNPHFKKVVTRNLKALKLGDKLAGIDSCMSLKPSEIKDYKPKITVIYAEENKTAAKFFENQHNHYSLSGHPTEGRDIKDEVRTRFLDEDQRTQLLKFFDRETKEYLPNLTVIVWPRGYTLYSSK